MQGLHLTADLFGCHVQGAPMADAAALRTVCMTAVAGCGLTPVGELFHHFVPAEPGGAAGVTGVVLLAESHLAVHTWPELQAVTLDVYVCNIGSDNSARAEQLLASLEAIFQPERAVRRRLTRGELA